MLKIRLSRVGKKHQPSFRVVVQEHTSAVKGKFIEELGYYRPATKDKELVFNLERVSYWIGNGAQPSDSVAVLLKKQGVSGMEKFIALRNRQKKSKKVVEAAKPAATPAAPAAAEAPATPAEAPAAPESPVAAPEAPAAPAQPEQTA